MDDPQSEIDQVEKRTRRYWFDDGLAEIGTGAGFLLVALSLLFARAFEDRLGRWVNLTFIVAVMIGTFVGQYAVRVAKDRYVHPRTGYVSFARPPANRWANAALGVVIGAIFAFAVSGARGLAEWIPTLIGVMLAAGLLAFGRITGRLRFPLAGISCAAVGLLLSMLRFSENLAAGLLFAWTGIVLVAGGIAAFRAYMRQAPPQIDGRVDNGAGENA